MLRLAFGAGVRGSGREKQNGREKEEERERKKKETKRERERKRDRKRKRGGRAEWKTLEKKTELVDETSCNR